MSKIDVIKRTVDIFDLFDKLGIPYKMRHTHNILCPVHSESQPSARVYAKSNSIYCFVCHITWDTVELVKVRLELSTVDTIKWFEANFTLPRVLSVDKVSLIKSIDKSKVDFDSIRVISQELFMASYDPSYCVLPFVQERIFWCWDEFEQLPRHSVQAYSDWLSSSKAIVSRALAAQKALMG